MVENVFIDECEKTARPGDFILSRVNAPLLGICLRLLMAGKRAHIKGKEVGKQIRNICKRSHAKDAKTLLDYAHEWAKIEKARLEKRKRSTTSVTDMEECIEVLCGGTNSIEEVYQRIERLFSVSDTVDDRSRITLSNTHKAKGLERDRVWVLRETYLRVGPNHSDIEAQEEENLFYVAVTRAKRELYLVKERPKVRVVSDDDDSYE